MLLSTNHELRLHAPNNAVDDVSIWLGYLDDSEKDFIIDKLGRPLYDRLCEFYEDTNAEDFYNDVINGTYKSNPWEVLLRDVQCATVNNALSRNFYSLILSINGVSINVAMSNDYGPADDRLVEKSVNEYKVKAFTNLNAMLNDLETWSKEVFIAYADGEEPDDELEAKAEITALWQKSRYYYQHSDLLIPTCEIFQNYLDIRESREKFIRLLPDLHFIQNQYILTIVGVDEMRKLLAICAGEQSGKIEKYSVEGQYLDKVRYLIIAYLEERTTVLSIDKMRRQQAHDESVSLKNNLLAFIQEQERKRKEDEEEEYDIEAYDEEYDDEDEIPEEGDDTSDGGDTEDSEDTPDTPNERPHHHPHHHKHHKRCHKRKKEEPQGFKNNQQGNKFFVSPLLY